MNLIIVESPTKAKTLTRFLGKDFSVEATYGHLKDLPKSKLGVDVEKNFAPDYQVVVGQEERIDALQKASKKAKLVFLATDPDREGEAIAQHAADVLTKSKYLRIVFHEITKEALKKALENPGKIKSHLVDAQIARRVLDRLVGYKLSPLLWKKVRRGLSAGRVQSVAVRLIVERENEIEKFKAEEYWEIACDLKTKTPKASNFRASLIKIGDKKAEVKNKKQAGSIVSDLKKSSYKVDSVRKRQVTKRPYPPFATSTMTQAAARLFGWPARKTMSIAQRLYEEGLITYHRTDSTSIASSAIEKVRKLITEKYGEKYLPESVRVFKTKAKTAQEAHEAIRPTNVAGKFKIRKSKFRKDAERLYEFIWKRFVACQMAAAVYDETIIDVGANRYLLRASGQIMKFDGWRILFKKKSDMILLPDVSENDPLSLIKVLSDQKFTQPPARYNEASLIKTLEKLGIGRPSTYAPTITTIKRRQYVEKIEKAFHPTHVGVAVNSFLISNFPDVFDYQFTADMEDDLDKVASGEIKWEGPIKNFYKPFEKKLVSVEKKAKRVKIEVEKLGRKCPECKKGELVIRVGKFGKFISCGRFPDCDYAEKYVEKIGMKCPDCKSGDVIIKPTRKGRKFFGCSNYPDCHWASWKKPEPE